MKALAFGEVLWDCYPEEKHIGGAPLNFAGHLCLQGNECQLLSSVGDDPLGDETLEAVRALGVGTVHVGRHADLPTGVCVVTLDGDGIPSFDLRRDVAYDRIDAAGVDPGSYDAIYYDTLSLRGEFNRNSLDTLLRAAGKCLKFCDLNVRPPHYSGEVIEYCIRHADIIKISDEELPLVLRAGFDSGETDPDPACRLLSGLCPNLSLIIITKGAAGSLAYETRSGRFFRCDAVKTRAVSTVGAGDSFSASFLSEYFRGKSVPDCLSFASRVSSYVVSVTAAVPKYDINCL